MPRPLAITHVLIYRQFGGMERYVLELCRWMKARGHAPSLLLSTGSPVADAARALEIPVRLAPIAGDANPLAPWHVARAVRQWGAELLNVHDNDSAVPCCLGGRLAGVPVVATVHAFHSSRWPFIAADHLLAVSAALGGHLRGQGFPAERVSVIRSGVDVAHFVPSDQRQARRDLGLAPEGVYFASTSRLSRGKGLALLIDAFTGVRPQAPH
ncbi:MAG TPA: glycosyltransferase family 4 protein, partial [Armatimonadota bacterium]